MKCRSYNYMRKNHLNSPIIILHCLHTYHSYAISHDGEMSQCGVVEDQIFNLEGKLGFNPCSATKFTARLHVNRYCLSAVQTWPSPQECWLGLYHQDKARRYSIFSTLERSLRAAFDRRLAEDSSHLSWSQTGVIMVDLQMLLTWRLHGAFAQSFLA